MKVNAVTPRNYHQNFNGLFKTIKEVKDDTYYEGAYEADFGTHRETTTIYYYPFMDESRYDIEKFVSHNTYYQETEPDNPNSCDQTTRIKEGIVHVLKPLSITAKEYENYKESIKTAKKIYELQQELARQAAIRALISNGAVQVEDELSKQGLDDWLMK